jgi:hypothetical protein
MSLLEQADIRRELDGLTAIFRTRADADLAIEHLAQEYGIDPAFIYAEPVDDENSAGVIASGGDHAAGAPSHRERPDAPLNGTIQLTVPVKHSRLAALIQALEETGAVDIELF